MMYGKWLTVVVMFVLAIAVTVSGITGAASSIFVEWPMGDGSEVGSPGDHISEDQIHVYEDRIVIELDGARWARFTDTNSMDPVLDDGANAIQIVPRDSDQIAIGDIISYSYGDRSIIHRVVDINYDENGWYAITKGDNLASPDKDKVRFDQVQKLVVGILY